MVRALSAFALRSPADLTEPLSSDTLTLRALQALNNAACHLALKTSGADVTLDVSTTKTVLAGQDVAAMSTSGSDGGCQLVVRTGRSDRRPEVMTTEDPTKDPRAVELEGADRADHQLAMTTGGADVALCYPATVTGGADLLRHLAVRTGGANVVCQLEVRTGGGDHVACQLAVRTGSGHVACQLAVRLGGADVACQLAVRMSGADWRPEVMTTKDPTKDPQELIKDPTKDPSKDSKMDLTKDTTKDSRNDLIKDPSEDPTKDLKDPTKDPRAVELEAAWISLFEVFVKGS
jgi:hypothetical protein